MPDRYLCLVGTGLVVLELIAVVCLFGWLDRQDEKLVSAGINIEQMTGEAHNGQK